MQSSWIDRLGNWNPQLLREFRGRLKSRSVVAAIALSAIGQILLLLIFLQDSADPLETRWLNLWKAITWILPYLLFSIGSYYISADLTQEEKRGTLGFIRLSPRPGWQILMGKLLGVPALVYLTVGLAVPLHFAAGGLANVPLPLMLSVYVMLIAGCIFCYSVAMLYSLLGSTPLGMPTRQATTAVSFAGLTFLFLAPLYMLWNINVTWRSFNIGSRFFDSNEPLITWSYMVINAQSWIAHIFTLANLGIATALIWGLLLRRYRQPRSTVLSKRQSYLILAYLEVLALGFFLRADWSSIDYQAQSGFAMYCFTFGLVLVLMLGLCPQRQMLLDWSRYRPQGWQSWLWADRSPALLAIVILLLIANALLLPWLFITGVAAHHPLETLITAVAASGALLIYGLFTQQIFAAKVRNPLIWAVGGLAGWLILPPTIVTLLQLDPLDVPAVTAIWTFLGYPSENFTHQNNLPFALIAIVAQWLLLAFLLYRFNHTLRQLKLRSQG